MVRSTNSDPIQEAIGSMSRWQIIISVALSLKSFPSAWNQLSIAVIAPRQDFTCVFPTPMNTNDSMLRACSVRINDSLPEVKCEQFTYDDTDFESTLASEWNLVCGRKFLLSLVQPATHLGILIGHLVFGVIADRIGRKTPLMIAVTVQAVAGIVTAFMPIFELFLLFKFISAIANGGTIIICFVIMIEVVGAEIRSKASFLYHIPFLIGFLSIPAISYQTRTWDGFWLVTTVPAIFLLSYYWLIPESPRWLLAVGKVEQARKVLLEAAKMNKMSSKKVIAAIDSHEKRLASVTPTSSNEDDNKQRTYGIIDLVRTPTMRLRTILLSVNYFNGGMVFFGVTQYLGHMSKNIRTNLAVSAAFQFPGLLIVYFLISRVSRVKILMSVNFLTGICLLLIIPFYKYNMLKLTFAATGITCMTIKSVTFHLYTGEVYPTVLRNIGFGVCCIVGKLGSIVAPLLIDYVNDVAFWIIPLIFGLSPILGAILFFWLPETKDCKLPENIGDIDH